jgi:hypothetical protein
MLIDEGSSVTILSSITWKALGYPQLVLVTQNLLAFNKRTSHPLGVLPQFPVTLGGKTIINDVMVVQDPLDFDLLLAMKSFVSVNLPKAVMAVTEATSKPLRVLDLALQDSERDLSV